MALHSEGHVEEEFVDASEHEDNEVNSPHSCHSLNSDQNIEISSLRGGAHLSGANVDAQVYPSGSRGRVFGSSSGGSGRTTFPGRNTGGDEGGSFRAHFSPSAPFLPSRGLTTASNLNNVKSCRDMMLNLAPPAIRTHQNCLTNHQTLQRAWFELDRETLTQANLLQSAVEKGKEDLLDKNKSQEERIKELDETLDAKSVALTEAEQVTSPTKKDLEQLTVDLSQAEIMKHNYVRHLLPTMAILATGPDYDPDCRATFQSSFNDLFTKIYPYVEKLIEAFRLPLGDLQNI
ncbi:hypothetical protein Tco_0047116 [Tanacetum coccineum]